MASRGVAILPAGMSQERFDWLDRWCANPRRGRHQDRRHREQRQGDLRRLQRSWPRIRPTSSSTSSASSATTSPTTRSPVGRSPTSSNTSRASSGRDLRLAAFTSATGSAGTIAAGDRLKEQYGTKIVAVEALECPTLLENGFGEHNIQGIGDKHVPLIHNVMNTDVVVAVSDRATDQLQVMFNTDDGLGYLADRRLVPQSVLRDARRTSGSRRSATCWRRSRRPRCSASAPTTRIDHRRHRRCGAVPERAGQDHGARLRRRVHRTSTPRRCGASTSPTCRPRTRIECTERDRNRIFNLGYYTWVEQQGTPFELFEARRSQEFWRGLRRFLAGVGRDDRRVQRPRRRQAELMELPLAPGWACAVCGAHVDIAEPLMWRCPTRPTRSAPRAAARAGRSHRCAASTIRTRSSPSGASWRGTVRRRRTA